VKTRSGPLLFLPRGQSRFQVSEHGAGVTASYAFLQQAADSSIWMSDDQGLRRVAGTPESDAVLQPYGKSSGGKAPFGNFTFAPDGSLWAVTNKGVQRCGSVGSCESFTPDSGLSSDTLSIIPYERAPKEKVKLPRSPTKEPATIRLR